MTGAGRTRLVLGTILERDVSLVYRRNEVEAYRKSDR
jgi:hypothetical protein